MSYGYPNQYDSRGGSMISGRVVIAIIIALISIATYYSKRVPNPITHEVQHLDLSVKQEIALGLQAAPEMAAQYGGPSHDVEAQERVRQVGNRVVLDSDAGHTDYRFHFTLLRDPNTVNAFALPGGQVFITTGLYKRIRTDGELAGVLGHEIGHVVARHGAQQLAKQQLTQGLEGAAVIGSYDPRHPGSSQAAAAISMAIGKLTTLRYGRKDETQADQLGVRLMSQAGYDPRSMIEVMHILEEASHGGNPPEFFSTHPNPEHRIERIRHEIDTQFPNGVPSGLIR
jgi:predicted Zn-dependent protease